MKPVPKQRSQLTAIPIPIDTSVEDWIEEIESKIIRKNRNVGLSNQFVDKTNCKTGSIQNAPSYIRNILKEIDIIDMKCSF